MPIFPNHYAINFYIKGDGKQFSRRILSQVPSVGDTLVFRDRRYQVDSIEWCLDEDATNNEYQALVNIDIMDILWAASLLRDKDGNVRHCDKCGKPISQNDVVYLGQKEFCSNNCVN